MRIISGKLKGKSIVYIKSKITRPLKDSVKENIFNIISHSNLLNINLNKSNILDLYSGVGSFGIECLSRGADEVIFVEKDKNAANTINTNLRTLSIKNKAKVFNESVTDFQFQRLRGRDIAHWANQRIGHGGGESSGQAVTEGPRRRSFQRPFNNDHRGKG